MAKFVELFNDEKDGMWKITIWTIPTKDFDPFQCEFENYCELRVHKDLIGHHEWVEYAEPHIHKASIRQREVAAELRKQGHEVFVNTADPRSFFQIIPKWLVQMIVGRKEE